MAPRQPIDLSSHINETHDSDQHARFPVELRPIYQQLNGSHVEVPSRRAVVREDTGRVLSVVSDRYQLVPHERILGAVNDAVTELDVSPIPRGVYLDRGGARMRALYKFPSLSQSVIKGDELCPCIKIQNTYDGTSRIAIHIGAFRFVCTNLAVGGGGVFASGFMAVHAGEIPIDKIAEKLKGFLAGFVAITNLYHAWADQSIGNTELEMMLGELPNRPARILRQELTKSHSRSVWEAYNAATHFATHRMRSVRTAFDLLDRINRIFQQQFTNLQVPISLN